MTTFFDSHAHLADPAFAVDREDVVSRARASGAVGIVCIGESLAAAASSRSLAERHPGYVFFTAGVHPHDAADFQAARDVEAIRSMLDAGAVAVGECGLDYHYDHSPRARQLEAFEQQLDLAAASGRSIVMHSRAAEADTRALVIDAGRRGIVGVLHCFTGSHDLARAALDAGWFISFSGIVTFKSWHDDELLRLVPDDRLLAESDSPYLAPVPNRGKRNEPAWVERTVERLASARRVSPVALGGLTIANARTFFGLAAAARLG